VAVGLYQYTAKCLSKWKDLHISSTLNNTTNYMTLLRNAYLSIYAVIQLSERWPSVRFQQQPCRPTHSVLWSIVSRPHCRTDNSHWNGFVNVCAATSRHDTIQPTGELTVPVDSQSGDPFCGLLAASTLHCYVPDPSTALTL